MAFIPYAIVSPNLALSIFGLFRGPDRTIPTPAEDWKTARVDVVIPALNEAAHVPLCLASVIRQTVRPRRIILIDDGSRDDTIGAARAFCALHGVELTAIKRGAPIGKTPTLKRQARELDSDVLFVLDADTVLESDFYIERTVQELYQAVGIASACGTILPQRRSDRRRWLEVPEVRAFREACPGHSMELSHPVREAARAITNVYRECLYLFLEKLVYRGENVFLGTITSPVGCAVAYRREYLCELFDHFGPILGDDLTNSEDIFIGLALLDMGYRNIQLSDVLARTVEPPVYRLPRQIYLWSSAFLQSCYYFDPLLRSPFKAIGRWLRRLGRPPGSHGPSQGSPDRRSRVAVLTPAMPGVPPGSAAASPATLLRLKVTPPDAAAPVSRGGGDGREHRVIAEPYRQPFGRSWTSARGRRAGWMLLFSAVEKIFFPTTILILMLLGAWWWVLVTAAVDTAIAVSVLAYAMKGKRLEYLAKGVAVTPFRYATLAVDLVTVGAFAWDIWITKDRRWRK